MTPQEIKDNAPEGATHYRRRTFPDGFVFYKYISGEKLMYWLGGKWRYTENTIDNHTIKPLN